MTGLGPTHRDCGTPWSEHEAGLCPDLVRTDLSAEKRERRDLLGDSRAFEAKHRGECAEGDRIEPGQPVRYVGGDLRHVECPAESEETAGIGKAVRPICARCSQELPASLVCGWCDE